MTETIAIVGAGAWGTALATILARGGHRVTLCVRRREQLERITSSGENAPYLPGIQLPAAIEFSDDWARAVGGKSVVVLAVPSRFARLALERIAIAVAPNATIVSATKGLEESSLKTMTVLASEVISTVSRVAALSGPGFAAEVAREKPAALVAAAADQAVAEQVQNLFARSSIRVYTSGDCRGVEMGGALKNVIAIAAGISDGLELGSSARAALITRGLAEIMRLGEACGARRETMAGLSGLGDLVLTCAGELSRNRTLGRAIGSGTPVAAATTMLGGAVAEGITTVRAVQHLAAAVKVEMPIAAAVYRCLYEDQAAPAMVRELLGRELKAEF